MCAISSGILLKLRTETPLNIYCRIQIRIFLVAHRLLWIQIITEVLFALFSLIITRERC